jgi:Arc/MetJ family transcription regulator
MPRMKKKTIELDQDYIDRLRKLLGARTEKAAVNKAMEMVLIDDEIIEAHKKAANKGDLLEELFE